jgi:hypothetical protein
VSAQTLSLLCTLAPFGLGLLLLAQTAARVLVARPRPFERVLAGGELALRPSRFHLRFTCATDPCAVYAVSEEKE